MKRTLLTSTAAIALILSPLAPAFAQEEAPAPAEEPAMILPSEDAGETDTMTGEAPAENAVPGEEQTEVAEADSSIFFIYEEDNQYRSTNLVGYTVTNSSEETLGDINDLVISSEGQLEGVIIGVGGFLGLGEKNVGVRFDALTVTEDRESGEIELVLNATREQLEEAPSFVTKEEQVAAEKRDEYMQEMGSDTGTTSAIPQADPNAATEPLEPAE